MHFYGHRFTIFIIIGWFINTTHYGLAMQAIASDNLLNQQGAIEIVKKHEPTQVALFEPLEEDIKTERGNSGLINYPLDKWPFDEKCYTSNSVMSQCVTVDKNKTTIIINMENIDLFYNRQTKNEIKNNFLKSRIASIVDTIKNEKTNQKKLQAFVCLQSLLMQAYAPSADQDTQGFSNNQQNPNTQLEEINRLKEELDREKSTCEYSQSALNKSLTERNSLTKHIIDLESQISGLQSQMRTLASLREEKKSLEIRLNTEQENYKTTAQRLREEIAYLNATAIIRVQEKASYLENKITTLKAQLSLTLAEKSNLEKEYDNKLTEAKKNFENQIQTLQEKYNALVKEKGATTPLVTNGITRQNTSDQSNKTQIIKSQNSGYKNYYLLMSSLILLAASAATTYRYGLIDVTNLAALRYKVSR